MGGSTHTGSVMSHNFLKLLSMILAMFPSYSDVFDGFGALYYARSVIGMVQAWRWVDSCS